MGLTNTGYVVPTKEEIRSDVQEIWKEAFGPNINLDVETPQGQIIEIMVDFLYKIENSRQDDFNARDVYKANGMQLDIIGREMGAPRKDAIPTQVTVSITGQTGYTIPSGTLFNLVSDPNVIFINENDIVISSSTQSATLIANDGQMYTNIQIGNQLQTVTYFQQVSNIIISSIAFGMIAEDDNTYRARLIRLKDSGVSDITNLQEKLLAISNVLDAKVKQNNTLETDTDNIPPHCIEIIVLGGNETDIGNVCLENVVMGTPTYLSPSGESIEVIDQQGFQQVYNITRPSSVSFDVTIHYKVKMNQVVSNQEIEDMQSRLEQYLNNKLIGQVIYVSDIMYVLLDGIQDKIEIFSLVVEVGGVEVESSYQLTIRQYAVAGTITIEEEQTRATQNNQLRSLSIEQNETNEEPEIETIEQFEEEGEQR